MEYHRPPSRRGWVAEDEDGVATLADDTSPPRPAHIDSPRPTRPPSACWSLYSSSHERIGAAIEYTQRESFDSPPSPTALLPSLLPSPSLGDDMSTLWGAIHGEMESISSSVQYLSVSAWQETARVLNEKSAAIVSPPQSHKCVRVRKVMALVLEHLSPKHAVPGYLGSIAALAQTSHTMYDLAQPKLYTNLHVTATNLAPLLRTLMPPTPDDKSLQDANARIQNIRLAVQKLHVRSLAPTSAAAQLSPPSKGLMSLTCARSVSLHSGACKELGESTLLATAVARLASPLALCVDLGAADKRTVKLAALTLASWILPSWSRLGVITLHNAQHVLGYPSKSINGLFRSGMRYRLVFGPLSRHDGAEWKEAMDLLRSLLGALKNAGSVQVVLPFDKHGSLPPSKPKRKAKDVGGRVPLAERTSPSQRATDATNTSRPPRATPTEAENLASLRPTKQAQNGTKHDSPRDLNGYTLSELPGLARRQVLGSKSPPVKLDFATIEEQARGAKGSKYCTCCDTAWL